MNRIGPVLVVLVLAGCGQMLDPDGGTPTPTPSPLPENVSQIRPSVEQTMAAGRYSDREFEPRLNFEVVGDTWYTVQRVEGFFDIQQGELESPHVIAVQFARPTAIYGEDGKAQPTDASHAAELLEANPDISVVETSTAQIAGLDGNQLTVENTGEEVAVFMDLPPGTIAINGGRRLWVAFFDTDDGLLAVMIGGSIERWDEALSAAEPVLESIVLDNDSPSGDQPAARVLAATS